MLNKLRKIVSKKSKLDEWQEWYKWSATYFEWIKNELEEVEFEMKKNNEVYLEDELWDLLWNYMSLLSSLKKEWKISTVESVLNRAEKKYKQRVEAIEHEETDEDKSAAWKAIKEVQKDLLKKQHNWKYHKKK